MYGRSAWNRRSTPNRASSAVTRLPSATVRPLREAGMFAHWSGCDESTSTMPTTSSGYRSVNIRTTSPPYEWPASTYGGPTPAARSAVCNSSALVAASLDPWPVSLQPSPARS